LGGTWLTDSSIETPQLKKINPEGITCPEGMWVKEAALRLAQKEMGDQWRQQSAENISQNLIHFLILTPVLDAFSINSFSGEKLPIDRGYLRSKQAIRHFINGFEPFRSDFHVSKTDGYFIFVDREQFVNYLDDKPIVEPPRNEQAANADPPYVSSYIPPYIQFMLTAVSELNLSAEKRINKSEIIYWLESNWPSDLDGKSKSLIEYMATILRKPEQKKGGNTSWGR
jgi:hypothetical protein